MNKIKKLFILIFIIHYTVSNAQNPDVITSKIDSVYSMAGMFKRSKISLGTDTLFEFKENNGIRNLNAINVRTIEKVRINNTKYYKVTTQNIPTAVDNVN